MEIQGEPAGPQDQNTGVEGGGAALGLGLGLGVRVRVRVSAWQRRVKVVEWVRVRMRSGVGGWVWGSGRALPVQLPSRKGVGGACARVAYFSCDLTQLGAGTGAGGAGAGA